MEKIKLDKWKESHSFTKPVGFKKKLQLLFAFGGISGGLTPAKSFIKQTYDIESFKKEINLDTRIENLGRETTYKIKEVEIDRLQHFFEVAFSTMAMKEISKDDIVSMEPIWLMRKIFQQKVEPEWANVDPISALLELVYICEPLQIELDILPSRRVDNEGGPDHIFYHSDTVKVLNPKDQFVLYIPGTNEYFGTQAKPIIINYSEKSGHTVEGEEFRAQVIEHIVEEYEAIETGEENIVDRIRWKIWNKTKQGYGQPFSVKAEKGQFGFIALSGFGSSIEKLLGHPIQNRILSNEDLKTLYTKVAANVASGITPYLGLFRYEVKLIKE